MKRLNLGSAIVIAAAALVIGAVVGRPGTGQAAAGGPTNSGTPTISGTAQQGQKLTVSNGGWGGSPTAFAYAWSLCDASGNSCTAISGATSASYTPAATDVGHTVRATVTATNSGGSGQATSAPSAVISAATAPTPTTAPSITGTPAVGSTLTANKGTWSGNPTSIAVQWDRCDSTGDSCAAINGATGDTYTVTQADASGTIRLSVTATNATGSTTFVSTQTAAVPGGSNGCPAGTGTIQIADLTPPARLQISKASISPSLVTLSTHRIQLHFTVTACNGRPVAGAQVFATPIPFNQFSGNQKLTADDGTVTLTESRLRGFPARSRHQNLLAVFARAAKPGEPILAGVSTRRTVAFRVHLP